MIALVRYVVADTSRSLRWVAPLLLFLATQAMFDATTGSVLPTYAGSAVVFFFVATWMTVAVVNSEDPVEEAIVIVAAGARWRVRLAKLATAYLFCVPLVILALVVPGLVARTAVTGSQLLTGAVAQAATVLAGVAVGSICSRPIVKRTAFSVLLGILVGLTDLVVPSGPPVHQVVNLLGQVQAHNLVLLTLAIAAETLALSAALVVASLRLARLRS